MLNKEKKQEFINDILETTKKALLSKIDRMPEHWNGGELRQLIEDYVTSEINCRSIKGERKRYKEYRNDCSILNI